MIFPNVLHSVLYADDTYIYV